MKWLKNLWHFTTLTIRVPWSTVSPASNSLYFLCRGVQGKTQPKRGKIRTVTHQWEASLAMVVVGPPGGVFFATNSTFGSTEKQIWERGGEGGGKPAASRSASGEVWEPPGSEEVPPTQGSGGRWSVDHWLHEDPLWGAVEQSRSLEIGHAT